MLTVQERSRLARNFTARLCWLEHVHVYWIAERRDIAARTVSAAREFRLPRGARLVGTYSHPFPSAEFLGDLDDLLEQIRIEHERTAGDRLAAA